MSIPELVEQKLAAFEAIREEFTASFAFVEAMHGQVRFDTLRVADAVRYLHACYICECKDRLLSVPITIRRYRGMEALTLLRNWQRGDTASVIAFLTDRLDGQPFAQLTQQIAEAERRADSEEPVQRLMHGRRILLNRAMNLLHLFDTIFTMPDAVLRRQVRLTCAALGHRPNQLARALLAFEEPVYAYMAHHALAQRNMLVMNAAGIDTLRQPADLPGARTWRVSPSIEPPGPFAEIPIHGYTELTSPLHNNLRGHRFTSHPDTPVDIANSVTLLIEEQP
jgi:hypothetical protein